MCTQLTRLILKQCAKKKRRKKNGKIVNVVNKVDKVPLIQFAMRVKAVNLKKNRRCVCLSRWRPVTICGHILCRREILQRINSNLWIYWHMWPPTLVHTLHQFERKKITNLNEKIGFFFCWENWWNKKPDTGYIT